MRIIALLPMKGHSERIPNKNIKPFAGFPLYHSVMKVLLSSEYITEIIIDTDSEIIAKDAEENFDRVRIINRPRELRGDFVSMNEIIAYDILQLEGEHFLQTHSTNPLLRVESLDRSITTYFKELKRYDSLFSVTRLQTRLYWDDASPINHNRLELIRTQDLSPVYEENSCIYLFSKKSFMQNGRNRTGMNPLMFEIDKLEAIDIDEPQDFELAEIIYSSRLT